MDEEHKSGLQSDYMEANSDPHTNLELARQNVLSLVDKAVAHEKAIEDLEQAHAAGKIDSERLKVELRERAKVYRKLDQAQEIFRLRCRELEGLNLPAENSPG